MANNSLKIKFVLKIWKHSMQLFFKKIPKYHLFLSDDTICDPLSQRIFTNFGHCNCLLSISHIIISIRLRDGLFGGWYGFRLWTFTTFLKSRFSPRIKFFIIINIFKRETTFSKRFKLLRIRTSAETFFGELSFSWNTRVPRNTL